MKRSLFVVLIIILTLCAACVHNKQSDNLSEQNTQRTSVPSVEAQPTVTPSVLNNSTFEPTVTNEVWLELEWAKVGEYIPDRLLNDGYLSN